MSSLGAKSPFNRMFDFIIYICIIITTLLCFLPFWMVLVGSFSEESTLRDNIFHMFPQKFSIYAYQYLLSGSQIYTSYMVTVTVTVVGTLLALCITIPYAYVISHPRVKYRNILSFLTYFTLILGGGLVGFYMLIAIWLNLKDSIWSLILPYLLSPFLSFILVSFFRSLPFELNEAATIDGANEFYILFRIICPISMPVIATVGLFYALQYWNDWFLSLLFIDNAKLHPLQLMIRSLISNINAAQYINSSFNYTNAVPSIGIQMSTVCLTIGPIIFLYPFLQKYFVKGLTIGAVKG